MKNKKPDNRSKNEALEFTDALSKTILNSLSANIAILDESGVIIETNAAWKNYASLNKMKGSNDCIGVNYLKLCDATTGKEAKDAHNVAAGIRSVIKGETKEFLYDYPCHGPDGRHFYYLRSIRVAEKDPIRVVVSHEDITALILAEEAARKRQRERDRLRQSLELAREIQQILLPKDNPKIDGLDVAGKSIYCDETGGDYFDFVRFKDKDAKLAVVVGDVAGHGISSALLMASVRSALRQRLALPGSISQIMTDVNCQLAGDLADYGQFVTLFYMLVDPARQTLEWVRAGHEPASLYDPVSDDFIELQGAGMALGVDKDYQYAKHRKDSFSKGSIVFIATDGVWEARNESGQMFGRKAVYEVIRNNATQSANDIMEAILGRIKVFLKPSKAEDDMTLVVVKVL
ncbi:MAG: SpoIIE family protein phosphatase [Desulfobacterales bacterium]|nr:SpoIIE family protein phosphatase [Desulfobacterales bacterium]